MALLSQEILQTVVSIEIQRGDETTTIATGFLFVKKIDDNQISKRGRVYLVTAKHVLFKNNQIKYREILVRMDKNGSGGQLFRAPLQDENGALFAIHPTADVAVLLLSVKALQDGDLKYRWFINDRDTVYKKTYEEFGVSVGDSVFVLGFPRGLRGVSANYAICRQGIIARLDQECLNDGYFWIDAPVFRGNSGGPVILRPEGFSIEGTKAVGSSCLLGLVSMWVNADDESGETENDLKGQMGLGKVVTTQAIERAIEEHEKMLIARKSSQ
ncbi:MAG: serine protease [Patescibacteria group bacterium]|nr:MAG: serine protease [Patescibacteria group bacterium]